MKEPVDIIREELESVRRKIAMKLAEFELLERIKRRCRFDEEPDPDILREDRDERERAEAFFLPSD